MKKILFGAIFMSLLLIVGCSANEASEAIPEEAISEEVTSEEVILEDGEEVAEIIEIEDDAIPEGPPQNAIGTAIDSPDAFMNDTNPVIEIRFTDGNVMRAQLFEELAPITVANFLSLVESEFYDGLIFHRIINNFMMQGGDPNGTGRGGSDQQIQGEFRDNGVENSLTHSFGVLSMARSQNMDSASSQFFIMNSESPFLDGSYAGFGYVYEGQEAITLYANVETGASDKPVEDIVIETIRIIEIEK